MASLASCRIILSAFILALLASHAWGQANRTWDGGGDGFSWSDAQNWDPADVPNNTPVTEKAIIGSTSVNRNIFTPSTSTTVQQMDWQQSANAVNQITLGNNLLVTTFGFTHNNSTSSAANMLVDLNGFTFTTSSDAGTQPLNNVTVRSTVPGGQLRPRNMNIGATSVIGSGVSVRPLIASSVVLNGTWDAGSMLTLNETAGGGTHTILTAPTPIGSVELGVGGLPVTMAINAGIVVTAQSNVALTSGSAITFNGNHVATTLALRGNFIDGGTGASPNFGANGTIAFYGSPFAPSTISTGRTLINTVRVGDNGGNPDFGGSTGVSTGNVKLAQDLTTTGAFIVRGGSRVNLDNYTITSGTFTADGTTPASGSIFTYTVGADPGLIAVTGNLTLNNFTLNINSQTSWVNGSTLTLFTYAGSLIGTPTLTIGQVPVIFSYDQFLTSGGSVRLTNLVLPEPTIGLMLVAGTLLLSPRRRLHRV